MCDQGHTMLFNSTKCEIKKGRYGKIVATASQAPNDIYVLDEATKACILVEEDESWLWHKQMSHINFENLLKITKRNQYEKCRKSQNLLTHYVRHVGMASRQKSNLK